MEINEIFSKSLWYYLIIDTNFNREDVKINDESLTSLLVQELIKSVKKSNSITEQGDLSKLENEARLQEIENRISEYQARVAQ